MAHLEEDIIERAKNTDMIALLESEEGFSFKSTYGEREFKCIEHNSLVVNGNRRRWYWNSRQVGGNNAIDYLVKIRGMNFRDAVLHLVGDREQTAYTPIRKAVTENVSVSNLYGLFCRNRLTFRTADEITVISLLILTRAEELI